MAPLQSLLLLATSLAALATCAALPGNPPAQPAASQEFVCPSEDIQRTRCLGPKDCLYPNPKTCYGYIQCSPKDNTYTTGIIHEMPCPANLMWNDSMKYCDYPSKDLCPVPKSLGYAA